MENLEVIADGETEGSNVAGSWLLSALRVSRAQPWLQRRKCDVREEETDCDVYCSDRIHLHRRRAGPNAGPTGENHKARPGQVHVAGIRERHVRDVLCRLPRNGGHRWVALGHGAEVSTHRPSLAKQEQRRKLSLDKSSVPHPQRSQ